MAYYIGCANDKYAIKNNDYNESQNKKQKKKIKREKEKNSNTTFFFSFSVYKKCKMYITQL